MFPSMIFIFLLLTCVLAAEKQIFLEIHRELIEDGLVLGKLSEPLVGKFTFTKFFKEVQGFKTYRFLVQVLSDKYHIISSMRALDCTEKPRLFRLSGACMKTKSTEDLTQEAADFLEAGICASGLIAPVDMEKIVWSPTSLAAPILVRNLDVMISKLSSHGAKFGIVMDIDRKEWHRNMRAIRTMELKEQQAEEYPAEKGKKEAKPEKASTAASKSQGNLVWV